MRQYVVPLWPVGLCWLFLMLCSLGLTYAFTRGYLSTAVECACVGFFFGQIALAAIIGGLVGRTWIAGWLLAVMLTAIAMLLCQLVMPSFQQDASEHLAIIAFTPVLMLAACAPLIALRALRGWSLTLRRRTSVPKERAGVEDLFLLSIVVACSISMLRLVAAFTPNFSEARQGLIIPLILFGFSLVFGAPTVWATFRARRWIHRLASWIAITTVVIATCLAMDLALSPDGWSRVRSTLWYVCVGVGSAVLTFALGAFTMRASGLRLTHYAKDSQHASSDFAAAKAAIISRRVRRQARWLTGAIALVALMGSGLLSLIDYRHVRFFENAQAWEKDSATAGSSISIRDESIVSLTVAPGTNDANFARYARLRDLERLSLAHSKVTDSIATELGNFRKLVVLDLSDTEFSDAGLELLRGVSGLQELSLARTRVSPREAFESANAMGVAKLDVSDLGITDDQLVDAFWPDRSWLKSLVLRGNPITDEGVTRLLQLPHQLNVLDLSHTAVDGSGLLSSPCPQSLILDGTKITDANLIKIMNANPGIGLSIKNTGITAQVLRAAANSQAELALGGGKITDRDLAQLGAVAFQSLKLNGPEFTGECIAEAGITVPYLDLSHSSVTDAILTRILDSNRAAITSLNLAHTQVTDAAVLALQQAYIYQVDLRHTKITAQGLLRPDFFYGGEVIVAHDQFSPAELSALRQRARIVIDEGFVLE